MKHVDPTYVVPPLQRATLAGRSVYHTLASHCLGRCREGELILQGLTNALASRDVQQIRQATEAAEVHVGFCGHCTAGAA